jgi:hypothetical protein
MARTAMLLSSMARTATTLSNMARTVMLLSNVADTATPPSSMILKHSQAIRDAVDLDTRATMVGEATVAIRE